MKRKNSFRKILIMTLIAVGFFPAAAGYSYSGSNNATTYSEQTTAAGDSIWLVAPTLVIEDNKVWVEGDGAENWNSIYANDEKLRISKGVASLENVEGNVINLRATLSSGVILIRKYKR